MSLQLLPTLFTVLQAYQFTRIAHVTYLTPFTHSHGQRCPCECVKGMKYVRQIRHMTITHFCSHQGSGYGHFVQINLDCGIEMSHTVGHYLLHNSFSSCARAILGPTTIHCVAIIDAFMVSHVPSKKAKHQRQKQLIILMLKMKSKLHTSLIPRPPLFLLFIPIHNNRPGLIHHVNDIR